MSQSKAEALATFLAAGFSSNQNLLDMIEALPAALYLTDAEGRLTYFNPAAERLSGRTPELGTDKWCVTWKMFRPDGEPLPADQCPLALALKGTPVPFGLECIGERPDGSRFRFTPYPAVLRDAGGHVAGGVNLLLDATEPSHAEHGSGRQGGEGGRVESEAGFRQLADDLSRANEDLERFAFTASHDLQEPLRMVKIYSELLGQRCAGGLTPDGLQYIRFIRSGATRMETLVRDLLAFTQVRNVERPGEAADANEALAAALSSLEGAIAESGAEVTADRLPAIRVQAIHLQQLFQLLVENAIKYRSRERAARVRITAERHSGNWVFAVADNGIGIEPAYQEEIFGLFKRLNASEENTGTGIGLAICRRITDCYHGRIWVESEPGRGSTFRVRLPS